jgi:hypothetical protein
MSMTPPTAAQISSALTRLEEMHSMLTLDEAAEILTGKKPSLAQRIRKKAETLWRDIYYAATAPARKTVDAIEGKLVIAGSELELLLRRCRKVGPIRELGIEVAYYEFPREGIRIIAADLRAALKGEPPLQFPDCIDELWRGQSQAQQAESPDVSTDKRYS